MLFDLTELRKFVWVSGFETKLDNVDEVLHEAQQKFSAASFQLVDLEKVAGSRYLLLAVLNALKSQQSKQPIAKTLGMEILLYVAADRQITEAIKHVGVGPTTKRIAGIVVGGSAGEVSNAGKHLSELLNQESQDRLLDEWTAGRIESVRSGFVIGDRELKAIRRLNEPIHEAVERLAIERSAMLTIRK